jgi:CDGSH-type Zn-finger protein
MSKPDCPQDFPYSVELAPGDYYWCSCGKSKNQPFCDGSHKNTDFTPVKFTVSEKKSYALCGCKKTKKPPYCDGSHNKL